jgi:hypothetical protein
MLARQAPLAKVYSSKSQVAAPAGEAVRGVRERLVSAVHQHQRAVSCGDRLFRQARDDRRPS